MTAPVADKLPKALPQIPRHTRLALEAVFRDRPSYFKPKAK
jgi:hypothetical protein